MALSPNTVLPGTGEKYAATERTVGGALAKVQHVLVAASDSPSVDAFGRWRVSSPQTIFASKLLHGDNQPLVWDEVLTGVMATSGPTEAKPFVDFTSTLNTAGTRTRQTFRRFNYQPGKGQLFTMTGVLEVATATATDVVRRIGAFDDDNGMFFESNDANTIDVVVRTNDSGTPVDAVRVSQASWNLDTMDGDGDAANPSGHTLDATKNQQFVFDFEWLSAGQLRIGLKIGGDIHYVHEFSSANELNIPWTSTPNLPMRYQMIVTGTATGVCSMRVLCNTVVSEGGTDDIGVTRRKSTAGAAVTCTDDNIIYAIVGVRLRSTHFGAAIKMMAMAMQIQNSSKSGEWILMWNPTVADTFTYSNLANSAVQTALGATANTVTGGTEMGGGFMSSTSGGAGSGESKEGLDTSLMLGSSISGTPDEIVLCFRTNGGTASPQVEGSLTWRELS